MGDAVVADGSGVDHVHLAPEVGQEQPALRLDDVVAEVQRAHACGKLADAPVGVFRGRPKTL